MSADRKSAQRWAWVGVVGLGLALAGYLALTQRGSPGLDQRLIQQARDLYANPFMRPSHVKPELVTKGSFGQALWPHAPALYKARGEYDKIKDPLRKECLEVKEGERPLAQLPAPCAELLEKSREAVLGTVQASRARSGLGPPEWRPWTHQPGRAIPHGGWSTLHTAALLSGLEMRRLASQGQHQEALQLCADLLGMGRDAQYGNDLGAVASMALIRNSLRPCAAVVAGAPVAELPGMVEQLQTIRAAVPELSVLLREGQVFWQIYFFGHSLKPEVMSQLPAGSQGLARMGLDDTQGLVRLPRLVVGALAPAARRELVAVSERQVRAAALPRADRDREFLAIGAELKDSLNPLVRELHDAFWNPSYNQLHDASFSTLDLLVTLAGARLFREQQGRWPLLLSDLEAPLANGLKLQPPRGALPVQLELKGGTLELWTDALAEPHHPEKRLRLEAPAP